MSPNKTRSWNIKPSSGKKTLLWDSDHLTSSRMMWLSFGDGGGDVDSSQRDLDSSLFLYDISIKLALMSCLSPFIRTRTCRLHMSLCVSNLDDYQNRYSACFQSSVSVIFISQIADKICYFRNVPLWLWCSILSNNVPPATISDASQITAHKHWVIWICGITSLNISNKRRAEGE